MSVVKMGRVWGGGEERETKAAKLLSQGFEAKTDKLKKSRFAINGPHVGGGEERKLKSLR